MTFAMPLYNATSVPGLGLSHSSAKSHISILRGLMTISFAPRSITARRIRDAATGWFELASEPVMTMQPASS